MSSKSPSGQKSLLPQVQKSTPTLPLSTSRFITSYGPKIKVSLTFPEGNGRTKQSHKDECDINQIMARYQKTGILDFTAKHEAQYGDVVGLDFQRGLEIIGQAKAMFADMPSKLRARFSNDPGEFLDFVQDPENREEARRLGLLKPEEQVATPPSAPAPRAASSPGEAPSGPKQGSEGATVPRKGD